MKSVTILIWLMLVVIMVSSVNAEMDLPEVKLVKQVDMTTILPGDTITYTITATNEGTNSVTDVTFLDAVPSWTTFLEASGTGTIAYCHDGSGTNFDGNQTLATTHIRWKLAEIPHSVTRTFVLKLKVK